MIGWKCSIGIISSWPSNLENYDWMDKNVNFVIPTCFNISEKERLSFSQSGIDLTSSFNILEQEMGQDYSSIYCYPVRGMGDGFIDIQEYVPSLYLGYPNTINFAKNYPRGSRLTIGVYIKSLNRFLYQGDDGRFYVYNVINSRPGNVIYVQNMGSGYLPLANTVTARPTGDYNFILSPYTIFSYTSKEDLVDEEKLGLFFISGLASGMSFYVLSDINGATISTESRAIWDSIFKDNVVEPDFNIPSGKPDNPYEPGGPSEEGGGGGTFDGDSDQIVDSSLPTLSAADTGFTRLYTPTLAQVQNLARYLWTDESIVETLWNVVKRYFEDPMQAFISFSIVPVPVPIAGQEEFKVLFIPTGVMLNTVANQFVDVDCGTFELKEYYGSALDYSPNTKVSCYLPYIGTVSLNTDDVMSRTLQVKYRVDICSGSCVAKILVDGNVIYQFPGCCSIPIPFSSADFSSYGSAIISAVKTGVAVAAAGAGMPQLGASIVGMNGSQQTGETYTKTTTTTERNPATGRQITMGTQKVTKEVSGTKASLEGIAQAGVANTANSVTASKTIVERSGSFSGNSGYLGVRRPYLIIERPRMCMPSNYQALNGFPSMITMELSSCKGYTRVQQVQLTGMDATNPEQAEILQLLKGGVVF